MERLSIRNAFLAFALIASSLNLSLGYAFAGGGFSAVEFAFFTLQLATPALAFFVGSHYSKRAERVVDALHLMAKGDLSQKLKIEGRDDFSWIAYEFDCARKATVELINLIKAHAQETAQAAAQLSALFDRVSSRSSQQSDAASAMAASVEEITVSIHHIADSAREAHHLATGSGRTSEEGAAVIRRTVEGIRHIAETARSASERVSQLGQHADQISSIVGVIKEIADQTNLLALNAAIEAARAGEYGRGFTVVADEVRKLAERTGASTQEIGEMVKTIQSGIAAVVEGMGPWVDQVEKEVELASRTGEAIEQIRESSARVVQVVTDISNTLKEQATVANDVAQTVEKVAQMAIDNSAAVQEADQTAKRFLNLASALRSTAERFKV